MSAPRFAVVIPVGPDTVDLSRGVMLIASLVTWEPEVGWCIVVEDAPNPRGLSDVRLLPRTCQSVTLMNPRRGQGHKWSGAVGTSMFAGLAWAQANTDADFIAILETDALVIGPFAEGVRSFIRRHPDAGMLGTIGISCNERVLQSFRREPTFVAVSRLLPPACEPGPHAGHNLFVAGVGLFTPEERQLFDTIRPHIAAAVSHGFDSSEFCQGGAQVVTQTMVDRMTAAGYLDRPEVWMDLPFFGDQILQMYVRAVDLRLYACTAPGEPFAVQNRGLPYTLEELVARRHGIIHSVKNDHRYSENEIREFFSRRAASAPGRVSNVALA